MAIVKAKLKPTIHFSNAGYWTIIPQNKNPAFDGGVYKRNQLRFKPRLIRSLGSYLGKQCLQLRFCQMLGCFYPNDLLQQQT